MYAKFYFPKGKNFKICFINPRNEYVIDSTGTMITLERDHIKYGIGTRVYYNSFKDAFYIARLWQDLIENSRTGYKYGIAIYCPDIIKYKYHKKDLWGMYKNDIKDLDSVIIL